MEKPDNTHRVFEAPVQTFNVKPFEFRPVKDAIDYLKKAVKKDRNLFKKP